MLLLCSVYFTKSIFVNIRTRFFKILLMLTILFIATEFIPFAFMTFLDFQDSSRVVLVSWKIHWVVGTFWFASFFYYCLVMIKNIEDNKSIIQTLLYDTFNKIACGVFAVFTILYAFVLKSRGLNMSKLDFLPGKTAIYVSIFCFSMFT